MRRLTWAVLILVPVVVAPLAPSQTGDWYFRFPLPNRSAYSVRINSILDHAMRAPYRGAGQSVAFTGETADGTQAESPSATINGVSLYGYKNRIGSKFLVNGNYTGDSTPDYLFYEGHPGYDFSTTDQPPGTGLSPGQYTITLQDSGQQITINVGADGIPVCTGETNNCRGRIAVLSPAEGRVETCDTEGPGCIRVDHGNGVKTVFLHTDQPTPPLVTTGKQVGAGTVIAVSSGTGGYPPHLHFEVKRRQPDGSYLRVDPYGWQGQYPDSLSARSTHLWTPRRHSASNVRWHPDGTIVTVDGTAFWLIQGRRKRFIPTVDVFYDYGFDFRNAISVDSREMECYPDGPELRRPPAARLIISNGAVFEITDQNRKRAFKSGEIFQGQGFRWSDIQAGDPSPYEDDADIPVYTSPFRDGTLVRSRNNPAVYVIANSRKWPLDSTAFEDLGYRTEGVIFADEPVVKPIPAGQTIDIGRITRCSGPSPPRSLRAIVR